MIQRLQTIYFVAIIAIGIMVSTGTLIAGTVSKDGLVSAYSLGIIYFKVYENGTLISSDIQYGLILILSVILGWTFRVLTLYKNRTKQIRLARWNYIFILMLITALFAKAIMYIPDFNFASQPMSAVFGLALLLFMAYLNFRAIALIKHDEALVKSADRIR